MILSYKKKLPWGDPTNFEQKILDDIKVHTIREDSKNRWHKERKIHHANGVRTKHYNCFKRNVCQSTQTITIACRSDPFLRAIDVDDKALCWLSRSGELGLPWMELLAKNDGFDSVEDFFKWFSSDFSGKIIHWTDFRY